jgi:hypothetical protein
VEPLQAPSADAAEDGTPEDDGAAPEPAPIPPRPDEKPGPPAPSGQDLVGLTTAETFQLLARPKETAKESPATVWTYEQAGCRLELFFYFDLESQEQRTLAFDLDPGGDAIGAEAFCLRSFATRGAEAAVGAAEAADAAAPTEAAEEAEAAKTGTPEAEAEAGETETPEAEAGGAEAEAAKSEPRNAAPAAEPDASVEEPRE